jgi:hypothetical protein
MATGPIRVKAEVLRLVIKLAGKQGSWSDKILRVCDMAIPEPKHEPGIKPETLRKLKG